ncbi:DENN domain-containing protein 2B-like isoform X2 [Petromyzon marinus]
MSVSNFIRRSFRRRSSYHPGTQLDTWRDDVADVREAHTLPKTGSSVRRTLELDLIEFQDRELFQYIVIVSLKAGRDGSPVSVPEITYQFPKPENMTKAMREEEKNLCNVIPLFCFPDGPDSYSNSQLKSETFSFMLTNIDGSRRFGYCRRFLPEGKEDRSSEVYCIISRLGCFELFSTILEEVETRRKISLAMVYPFVRALKDAPFPAPGKTVKVQSFIPGRGTETIKLTRPLDSRLEHVELGTLFSSLSVEQVVQVFVSLLLERRVILVAQELSQLSRCIHAVVALLYPFSWQHTYIPVLPPSLIDTVCSPTPFIMGLQSSSLGLLDGQPMEEVLLVDLCKKKFLKKVGDEFTLLPHKLQTPLVEELRRCFERYERSGDSPSASASLNKEVSAAFIELHLQLVGHYPHHVGTEGRPQQFDSRQFRKALASRSTRHFLKVFVQTQAFQGFIQEREQGCTPTQGLFEQKVQENLRKEKVKKRISLAGKLRKS